MTMTTRLAEPTYLRLKSTPFDNTALSIREHLPLSAAAAPNTQPLILLTFHPGFLAGSYEGWDYFAHLSALLWQSQLAQHRLRIFTINHPGYDTPQGEKIHRNRLGPYSIKHQPLAIQAALSWLLTNPLAEEKEIIWLAYGHSMGGLALSRYQSNGLLNGLNRHDRTVHLTKILSAPALVLHRQTLSNRGQLDLLHTIKQTAGWLPLYTPVAVGLYRLLAPLLYRLAADRFSIQDLKADFDFGQVNPFMLLEQGRELLRFGIAAAGGTSLLADTHIILARQDNMVDVPAIQELIEEAQLDDYKVVQHSLEGTHLVELDDPQAVVEVITQVWQGVWRERELLGTQENS